VKQVIADIKLSWNIHSERQSRWEIFDLWKYF